ncbi:MAG TPA: hypothetical protein VGR62_21395 [Candidatus Binatia bacterium]|nr:hypothetical protein [Candidatus Binatia bacterium]
MTKTPLRTLILAAAALLPSLAGAASECMTAKCQNEAEITTMQTQLGTECECAGAASAAKHMACVKKSITKAIKAGAFPKSCKTAVARCEAAVGCGKGIRPFRTVQQVFQQSCALPTCHSTITRQGGLALDSEAVSYTSLVNRKAAHAEANGAVLVVPGDPKSSFLIQKLRGQAPGDAMPQAARPLSAGTIKLIEQWIKRGAKATEDECQPADALPAGAKKSGKTCNDRPLQTGNFVWQPEPALPPPPAGEGFQLYTPPRPVDAGTEWETCYAFKNIDWPGMSAAMGYQAGEIPSIRQQTYRMHEGSHHLLVYAYYGAFPDDWADGYFPCSAAACESSNPQDCPSDAGTFTIPIGGTQVAGTRYDVVYPQGVGIPVLSQRMVLIANLHYTNPFQPAQPIYGESWLNMYLYKPKEAKAILDGIFAINFGDLFVEPYQSRTISRVWRPRGLLGGGVVDAAVFNLFGHMHKRGSQFQIDILRGGHCSNNPEFVCGRDDDCRCWPGRADCVEESTCQREPTAEDSPIYYTTAWDRAPILEFQKPYLLLDKDEGLRWTCTHVNGVEGDPAKPPKRCGAGCEACGWDDASRTCIFQRGVDRGFQSTLHTYQEGEPMPVIFGELADDDMCNMFGYFIHQDDLPRLP